MNPDILVVEDDTALCDLLTWNLSAEGYGVRSTGDGEEALLMVREQAPDAIILDWLIEQRHWALLEPLEVEYRDAFAKFFINHPDEFRLGAVHADGYRHSVTGVAEMPSRFSAVAR